MLGSLNSDVTRKYVVYALATRRSWAKIERVRPGLVEADRREQGREPDSVTASARGSQSAYGARATAATRAEKGKTKNRSSIDPCSTSSAQSSETDAHAMNAAAGQESHGEIALSWSPRTERTRRASTAPASTR